MPETGCAGQVEAKKAVSLATVAVQRAGESSLSYFSFLFLFFLFSPSSGKEVRCSVLSSHCFFCSRYLLHQHREGGSLCTAPVAVVYFS